MDVDFVVLNGRVVDGTGAPGFMADLGVRGERIVAVSRPGDGELQGRAVVDAAGLTVTPGFVDTNTHADWAVPTTTASDLLAPLLRQGVTTVVTGGCGFSPAPVDPAHRAELELLSRFLHDRGFGYDWLSFKEFADACRDARPLVNVALMVGQQALRTAVAGARPGRLSRDQLRRLRELLVESLEAGAVGISANTGFVPGVHAGPDEVRLLAEQAAVADVVLAVHARAYTTLSPTYPPWPRPPHVIRAIRDLTTLARRTGVRLQISHLGVAGRRGWRLTGALLDEIRRADADVGFDVVPYPLGVGPLQMVFPPWAVAPLTAGQVTPVLRARMRTMVWLQRHLLGMDFADIELLRSTDPALASWCGLDFAEIGRRRGLHPLDAQLEVARRTRLGAAVALHTFSGDEGDDDPLAGLLGHPDAIVVSNAAFSAEGEPNPAARGTFPRLLARYVRERRTLSLEAAVRRATSLPADRYHLRDVGRIAEGRRADLVVLDPSAIADGGWPRRSQSPPAGIQTVVLGGTVVADHGAVRPGRRRGRLLRR